MGWVKASWLSREFIKFDLKGKVRRYQLVIYLAGSGKSVILLYNVRKEDFGRFCALWVSHPVIQFPISIRYRP